MEIDFPYLQAIDVVFTLEKPKRTLEVKEKKTGSVFIGEKKTKL